MKQQSKESLLQQVELKVVNVGLEHFAQSLQQQDVKVVHVAWKPPADGDRELMKMLEQLL